MISIFLHIYYPGSLEDMLKRLEPFWINGHYLLINLVWDTHAELPHVNEAKNIVIIRSPNKGKDIGGKLALLDVYLRLGLKSEYMIFLHDKRSPHSAAGLFWRTELYKILDDKNSAAIRSLFQHKKTGIVGVKNFIKNEWDAGTQAFLTTNNAILHSLLQTYGFTLTDYPFIAGTMYWMRSVIYEDFFSQHPPLKIRAQLEEGNILDNAAGSITHAWERMLSWIALEKGYKIAGI